MSPSWQPRFAKSFFLQIKNKIFPEAQTTTTQWHHRIFFATFFLSKVEPPLSKINNLIAKTFHFLLRRWKFRNSKKVLLKAETFVIEFSSINVLWYWILSYAKLQKFRSLIVLFIPPCVTRKLLNVKTLSCIKWKFYHHISVHKTVVTK